MKETRRFFDEYAQDFDALYGVARNPINRMLNPLLRKSMRLRFEKTLEYAAPVDGKTVLDIGCGPGHYAIALARAGAKKVVGVDFAGEMLKLAEQKAESNGVASICQFIAADIFEYSPDEPFDYSVLMGFMDYIADPGRAIDKAISLTREKIFFSFPRDGGLLAMQRKVRYRNRCPLYLYTENRLNDLFASYPNFSYRIEPISRDYFVSLSLKKG